MKWKGITFLGILLGTAAVTSPVMSADHKDAPATIADPASDINDVFVFLDGPNVVLAMTVSPFAGAAAKFSDATQYVFHVSSGKGFGATTADMNVICTFDAAQKVSCWAGTADYVTGDASKETGLASADGKMKVFTGMRSDPFYFNLQGFKDAVKAVEGAASSLTFDGSGCPAVDAGTAGLLGGILKEKTSSDPAASSKTQEDDFATANTLAIVVTLPVTMLNSGGDIISVWGSTNKAK